MTADQIISLLKLKPLPVEGGYFSVTYQSEDHLEQSYLPKRYTSGRSAGSAIYYLVRPESFSALHKLPTDEIYYYHFGDPLEMLLLSPDGEGQCRILGMNLASGERPQCLVPQGWWQGSRPLPGGRYGYTLVSTSMAPAYHETDPVFGDRDTLMSKYPGFSELITALTNGSFGK